jgi:hypothetical protein
MSRIIVRPVLSPEDRSAVFRLRYEVYVKEMNRPQHYANHTKCEIEEPLDTTGHILGAFLGSEVVGTMRTNLLRFASVGIYEELYGLSNLPFAARRCTSVTTKLIVSSLFRKTRAALLLTRACYNFGLANEVEEDYMDCNSHLVGFFEGLGFSVANIATHPEYGLVTVMRLRLRDSAHLTSVGSPFVKDLKAFGECRERGVPND